MLEVARVLLEGLLQARSGKEAPAMETILQDVRYAARTLAARPGFTLAVVLLLALGIGANSAMFAVANSLVLRPLPLREVERLVFPVAMYREDPSPVQVSAHELVAWEQEASAFESFASAQVNGFNLGGEGEPERVEGAAITPDYLTALGVRPLLGRGFLPEEARAAQPAVALLGYGLWSRRYGADPGVVGRPIRLDGRELTVVGVLGPGFDLPFSTELWVPFEPAALPAQAQAPHAFFGVGRLKPGVSIRAAEEELRRISLRMEDRHATQKGWSVRLIPLRQQLMGDLDGRIPQTLVVLLGAVGFLLLIACVNIAGLFVARALGRTHEMSVRAALGASRSRLIRQLLTESLLLALLGGGLGLLFAAWITPPLVALSPVEALALSSTFFDVSLDARVLGFTLLVSVLTAVIFGLPAALRLTGTDLEELLRQGRSGGGRSERRLLHALVVVEIAVSLALFVGAGLMAGSFVRLQGLDLGFRPQDLVSLRLTLPESKYPEPEQRVSFFDQALERVRAIPGVAAAGTTTNIPLAHNSWDTLVACQGGRIRPEEPMFTAHRFVSAGYLSTLGLTLLKGRDLTVEDRTGGAPVVVISEEFARRCWPGEEPLGKQVGPANPNSPLPKKLTVVGLVGDVREDRAAYRRARPAWYLPYARHAPAGPVDLVVRSARPASELAGLVREAIRSVDPELPLYEVTTLEAHLAEFLAPELFGVLLLGLFAGLGLSFAALGLYGVLSYSVRLRMRELGIRAALGAAPRDLRRLIVGHGLSLAGLGLALGLAASLALTRLMSGLLFGVSATDPATFAAACGVLAVVAGLACLLPARRATRIDPSVVLRYE
jgi:putative ABC transport system permease protein